MFYVTEDGIEYKGIVGEFDEDEDEITIDDLIFALDPDDEWTNTDITLSIEIDFDTDDTLQYSYDGETWEDYDDDLVFDTNDTIYVRLVDDDGNESSDVFEYEITNIDKLPPKDFTPTVENVTSSTITISAETEDADETDEYGSSGIDHYEYSIDGGETWIETTDTTYTFTGLEEGTEYTIIVKAVDKAGNETETDPITVTTDVVPDGDDEVEVENDDGDTETTTVITFSYSNTDWTNKNVLVTVNVNGDAAEKVADGTYTLQYSLDGVTWKTYPSSGITFRTNGTIYARLTDGTNTGNYTSATITNIDKLTPNTFAATIDEVTYDSITVSGGTTDQTATSEYGCSGIDHYEYSLDGGLTWETSEDSTYTFEDVESGTEYTVVIKAVDKAGNETITDITDDLTGTIVPPDLSEDYVVITQDTYDWTNEDVIVTIDITDEDILEKITDGDYDIEYSTDGGKTWQKYRPGDEIEIEENCTLEVRLTDGTNTGGTVSTEITNIDKTAPTASIEITDYSTNSITVVATGKDDDSGVYSYEFQISTDGKTWESIATFVSSDETYEYTYEGLEDNVKYYVKVVVTDIAGNSTESARRYTTTEQMPDATDEVDDGNGNLVSVLTFSYSTSEWTNQDVIAYITANGDYTSLVADGTYYIEYSTNGKAWYTYTSSGVTYSTNGTIYARLNDGTNAGGSISDDITNIDKLAPNSFTVTIDEVTDDIITFSGETTDQEATTKYGCSGIDHYEFSIDGGETWTVDDGTSYTFSGLSIGTEYTVMMKAVDVAGNEIITETSDELTGVIVPADLETSDVSFTQDDYDWTNDDVIVYVEITDEDIQDKIDDGKYYIEYSIDGGETWEEYDEDAGITVEENTTVEVRLTDGEYSGDSTSHEITNIDKTAPVINDLSALTGSITIEATDASSGIVGYYVSTSSSTPYEDVFVDCSDDGEGITDLELTVKGLIQETTYYVWVIDAAGNISESKSATTGKVPGADDYIDTNTTVLTIIYSTTEWTNQDVTVRVVANGDYADLVEDGTYIIEYCTDITDWQTMPTSGVAFKINQSIYVRLSDGTNAGEYATGTIANIDKLAPNAFTAEASSTTCTITISGETTDQVATEYYGCSGIAGYQYSKDGGATWTDLTDETSYTFTELLQTTTYTVVMKAVDNAGNETTSTLAVTTQTVPDGASYITLTPSTTDWTNEDVAVTVTSSVSGYYIQTSTDGTTWTTTSSKTTSTTATATENCIVYARLYDGTNVGAYNSATISKIDKVDPSASSTSITSTTSTVVWNVTGTDSSSGVKTIAFYIGTSTSSYSKKYTSTCSSDQTSSYSYTYTFTGLTQTTTYYVKAIVIDYAGNTYTITSSKTTGTVPILTSSTLTTSYSPTAWTSGDVTVTASVSSDYSSYTLQYSTDASTWSTYLSGVTVSTNNTTVYFRLYDGTNASTSNYAALTVTNIDKVVPTATSSSLSSTTSTIVWKVTGADTLSGVQSIAFYIGTSTSSYSLKYTATCSTEETSSYSYTYTFTGLTQTTTYYLKAVVTDYVGNTSTNLTKSKATSTVPSGTTYLTLTPSTTDWTNSSVTVTVTSSTSGYYIQTSTDGSTWTTTSSTATSTTRTVSSNCTVYARLYDGTNGGTTNSVTISNIDTTAPTVSTSTSKSTSTITYTATVTDSASGAYQAKFYLSTDGSTYTLKSTKTCSTEETSSYTFSYTYSSLTAGTTYYIKVIVTDYAGNATTKSTNVTTSSMPAGSSYITFSGAPTSWTNSSVTITVTSSTSGYYIQTSTDGSTWTTTSSTTTSTTVTVSANCTVYARLYDGTNTGSNASLTITYIDKTAPSTASLSVTDYDDSSITVKATGADALSGVAKYAFQLSTDNSSWTTKATKSSTASSYSYTYSSLSSGTKYYMRVIVYDAAGNSKTSSSVNQTTDKKLYLYYYGDECEDVTGGWTGGSAYGKSSIPHVYTKNSNNLYLDAGRSSASSGTNYGEAWFRTTNEITLSDYSSVNFLVTYKLYNYHPGGAAVQATLTYGFYSAGVSGTLTRYMSTGTTSATLETITVNKGTATSSSIFIDAYAYTAKENYAECEVYCYAVWLE